MEVMTALSLHLQAYATAVLVNFRQYIGINTPRLNSVDPVIPVDIAFDSLSQQFYDELIGFTLTDCVQLYDLLHIPEFFVINEGRHWFRVHGVHSFLYFLYRMRSTSQRQSLDSAQYIYYI